MPRLITGAIPMGCISKLYLDEPRTHLKFSEPSISMHMQRLTPPSGIGIDPGGGLVQEDNLGVADERDAHGQLPLLPSREAAGQLVGLVREVDVAEDDLNLGGDLVLRHPPDSGEEDEVLCGRELVEEDVVLGADAGHLSDLLHLVAVGDVVAEYVRLPRSRRRHA